MLLTTEITLASALPAFVVCVFHLHQTLIFAGPLHFAGISVHLEGIKLYAQSD
jgi:hypothetical protein